MMPGRRPTQRELEARLAEVRTNLGLMRSAYAAVGAAIAQGQKMRQVGDRAVDQRQVKAKGELAGAERALRVAIGLYEKAEDGLEYRIANPW